jgi:hypothetical protein
MFEENEIKPENQEEPKPPIEGEGQKPDPAEDDKGATDQSEEIERLKKENADKDALFAKQKKEIEQQRYTLGKMDKTIQKAKEGGFVDDEPAGGISEEKVGEIVEERNRPILEAIQTMGKTISELARSNKANPTKGGGDPGQNQPPAPKEPVLPALAKSIVQKNKLVWQGKGYVYKSPATGKVYDLADDSDIK